MTRRAVGLLAQYALGAGIMAWLISQHWSDPGDGGPGLSDALAGPIQATPLFLGSAVCLLGLLLMYLRWYVLVRVQGLPFTLADALRLGSIGMFLGTFLPGSVSGDVVRAALVAREQQRRAVAVATVVMDRALGLWGLSWLIALVGGAAWALGDPVVRGSDGLLLIIGVATLVVAVTTCAWALLGAVPGPRDGAGPGRPGSLPLLGRVAAGLWQAVRLYRSRNRCVVLALALSLASQACFVLAFFCAAHVLGDAAAGRVPALWEHFVMVPVGETVQAFFPAPGGAGGAEYSYAKLYLLAGSTESHGLLAALGYRVIMWSWYFIGYMASAWIGPDRRAAAT